MTSGRDRLAAAIRGQTLDRAPVFCNLLDQGARAMGVSIKDYYADGQLVAEAQLRMRAAFGYDNLWTLFYVGKEAELLGCRRVLFPEDGPPNVGHLVIDGPAGVDALHVPEDVSAHPAFLQPLRCLRALRAGSGGLWPLCAYVTASTTLPAILMGMEKWMDLLLNGPATVRDALLEKCNLFFARQVEAYRREGADLFVYSNPFGSTDILPMRIIDSAIFPWMERDIAAAGAAGMVYYCGGARVGPVITRVLERLGLSAFYLSPWDDIAAAKRLLSGRALCAGVINDIPLARWPPERIRAEVRRIFEAGARGGGFLFGTLLMPLAIPEASIRVMLEEAYACGRDIR